MRTTITVEEGLLTALKDAAHRRGASVSQLISEAVRQLLASEAPSPAEPFRLVTFRGDGPLPGVDLDRTSELLDQENLDSLRRA